MITVHCSDCRLVDYSGYRVVSLSYEHCRLKWLLVGKLTLCTLYITVAVGKSAYDTNTVYYSSYKLVILRYEHCRLQWLYGGKLTL